MDFNGRVLAEVSLESGTIFDKEKGMNTWIALCRGLNIV